MTAVQGVLRERGWLAHDDALSQEPRDHGSGLGAVPLSAASAVA
jgi:hypothetical protein